RPLRRGVAHQAQRRRRECLRRGRPAQQRRVRRAGSRVSHKQYREEFSSRHIGAGPDAQKHMLDVLGYTTVEALVEAAVPDSIRDDSLESILPPAATEREAITELRTLAGLNRVNRSLIGLGYYDTLTPAVIKRNVLENPSWYTAYTPYQPEISQGRLEALINFQTMVSDLTGMKTANSSMLDEGTAAVEGMLLARRASASASNVFLVDQ